jgi:DNA-binding transcriptional LysR family regulator
MALTESGRAAAERVSAVLADWDALVHQTRSVAARAARILRVGYTASAANEITQEIVSAFRSRHPDWKVEMQQAAWSNPSAGLADGTVDTAFVRLPFPGQDRIHLEVLFTEPRCIALPTTHPLAAAGDPVPFSALLDEPFVAAPAETGPWRDFWLAEQERQGHPVRIGAEVEHREDWLNAIANGDGIGLAPESAARFYARPGITYRPVTGVSPTRVAVAWSPPADASTVVADFVACCQEAARSARLPAQGRIDNGGHGPA